LSAIFKLNQSILVSCSLSCYSQHHFNAGVLSLCTLPAISVDRLLALLSGIRYRQVVTCKRVLLVVTCFWAKCIVFSATSFWTYKFLKYYSFISVMLCVVISICCYIKIYRDLFHHRAQIQEYSHQGSKTDMEY